MSRLEKNFKSIKLCFQKKKIDFLRKGYGAFF